MIEPDESRCYYCQQADTINVGSATGQTTENKEDRMTNEQAALIAAAALHGGHADSQSWRVLNTARDFITWLEFKDETR